MRRILLVLSGGLFAPALTAPALFALEGEVGIHDPSTVIASGGRFYTYGTGGGLPILVSDDGWNWRRAGTVMEAVPGGQAGPEVLARGGTNTWAPDIVHIGDRYFLYYSAPGQQPKAAIGLLTATTLDADAPDYGWQDGGPVVWSDGLEDSNAIDPGVFLDPTDGRLWLTYGSYFGYIRLVELDPESGQRLHPDAAPIDIAINSEASIMIYRDGWYYLLVTHGSCCRGATSTYNIRMGRSRGVTGPFVDNMGIDMLQGGGKLFLGSGGRRIGPGHFGLLDDGGGVQKFSLHYEADLDRGGISVLDIRPLLWRDGWPVAGDHLTPGTFQIRSARTGTALELAVEGMPVGGRARFRGGNPGQPIADQDAADVAAAWPEGQLGLRMSPYMLQAQQKWAISPVEGAGGYPGEPWFRISIDGTGRSLAATADGEVVAVPAFTGADEELWRIDQLTDGSYRLVTRAFTDGGAPLALSAAGSSRPTLDRFDPDSDRQRWHLDAP